MKQERRVEKMWLFGSKPKTVDDMWKNAKDNNKKLLSDFNAPFWNEYINNSTRYDKLFRRLYKNFRYFMQESDEDVDDITDNFIDDVYTHLMVNRKKYEELYRVYVITDEDYSIVDNYHIIENMDKDTTSNNENTYGSRSDGTIIGQHTDTHENKKSPYNDGGYSDNDMDTDVYGQRSDTFTKGSQEDTLNNTGTEDYTLTRRGNIGVQTGTEMLDKHTKYWDKYKFYEYIFACICADLLLV